MKNIVSWELYCIKINTHINNLVFFYIYILYVKDTLNTLMYVLKHCCYSMCLIFVTIKTFSIHITY